MPFIKKVIKVDKPKKLFLALMNEFNISQKDAQKMIDTKKVYIDKKVFLDKSATIDKNIEVVYFEPITKGLKPIFDTKDFAVFDKPSGIMVHPKNRNSGYTLLDEVRFYFGNFANITHRIDKETSGLVLISKNKNAEKILKTSFEEKKIKKSYLALVKGELEKELFIDEPIKKNRDYSNIKLKVFIDKSGKKAQTFIKPIRYYPSLDATLIEAFPLTGRQHQIRVHLFHVKHPILGDPIYGVDNIFAAAYLDGKIDEKERIKYTGAKRLMLHAKYLEFKYKKVIYKIYSKYNFEKEFNLFL